jgi:hypothetical protein
VRWHGVCLQRKSVVFLGLLASASAFQAGVFAPGFAKTTGRSVQLRRSAPLNHTLHDANKMIAGHYSGDATSALLLRSYVCARVHKIACRRIFDASISDWLTYT